jgi:hypothetical protein
MRLGVVLREDEQVLRIAMMNSELFVLTTLTITFPSICHLFKSFSIIKNSDPSSKFSAICGTTSAILALPAAS